MVNRAVALLAFAFVLPVMASTSAAGDRDLLWRVVQACLLTRDLVGTPFPCLAVETARGKDRGFAVVRAPFEATHIVVTPTVRTVGIEAERLRASDAPNYFADAWSERHFVTDNLRRRPDRTDIALAVNSRSGRSQDQLHIHVDCIRQDVKRSLAAQAGSIRPGAWTRVAVLPRAPRYLATALASPDLDGTNIFKLVQSGLEIDPEDMHEVTVVVVGTESQGRPGYVVLARRRIPNSRDEAHGEALMDHACSAFR